MVNGEGAGLLRVELVFSPRAREVHVHALALAAGSTVADALRAVDEPALKAWLASAAGEAFTVGVWGRRQPLAHVLRDLDRVEVYRPLTVDPKEARRQRFTKAGGAKTLRERRKAALAALAASR